MAYLCGKCTVGNVHVSATPAEARLHHRLAHDERFCRDASCELKDTACELPPNHRGRHKAIRNRALLTWSNSGDCTWKSLLGYGVKESGELFPGEA